MHSHCSFKTHVECNCRHGICWAQPAPVPGPFVWFTRRDLLVTIAFGAFVSAITYVALSMADEHYRIEALERQESVSWK